MGNLQCPGMSPANFKPEDIKIRKCLKCGEELEFWKDDVELKCYKCGAVNQNKDIKNTCAYWCDNAAACLGTEAINKLKDCNAASRNY